jgi:hypothetical protein
MNYRSSAHFFEIVDSLLFDFVADLQTLPENGGRKIFTAARRRRTFTDHSPPKHFLAHAISLPSSLCSLRFGARKTTTVTKNAPPELSMLFLAQSIAIVFFLSQFC